MYQYSKFLKLVFCLITLSILWSSCRKDNALIDDPSKYTDSNFNSVFNSFWHGLNNNYAFWDIETTDWDEMYDKYAPLFDELQKSNKTNDEKNEIAYGYFKEMTKDFADGHFLVSAYSWGFKYINPSENRKVASALGHNPLPNDYFIHLLAPNYLDAGYLSSVNDLPINDEYASVVGKVNNNLLYFRFNSFKLSNINNSNEITDRKKVLDYYVNEVRNNDDLEGLIVDLRSNEGGNIFDLSILLGNLTDKSYVFGSLRYKAGNNRLDYTPWLDVHVTPQKDTKAFNKPIVVLIDMHSASMAELSTCAFRQLPSSKVTVVGEVSWGGMGPLVSLMDIYNSGPFSNSYFSKVRTSTAAFKYVDGVNYENKGLVPDFILNFNVEKLNEGIDEPLEKAIEILSR